MQRRDALRSATALLGGASLAGCLDALASESAWRDLVVDRPEEVYVPPEVDGMVAWGTARTDEYAIALSATRPHRFWTVTGRETTQIAMREAHSVHLMASVHDPDTGHHVPAEVAVGIERDGDPVLDRTLWPMLSQRMGVHHGDNVALPRDGVYTAVLRVVPQSGRPPDASAVGAEIGPDPAPTPATVRIDFEYDASIIEALDRRILEEHRRGRPGAVEPMGRADHAGHERDHTKEEHPPTPTARPPESLPGTVGIGEEGDCKLVVAIVPADRENESEGESGSEVENEERTYLAVSPRTPYNGFPLRRASLSATVGGGADDRTSLYETTTAGLGHHYGAVVDPIGDAELRVAFDAPPQIARHEGYETAFFEVGPITPSFSR